MGGLAGSRPALLSSCISAQALALGPAALPVPGHPVPDPDLPALPCTCLLAADMSGNHRSPACARLGSPKLLCSSCTGTVGLPCANEDAALSLFTVTSSLVPDWQLRWYKVKTLFPVSHYPVFKPV